jgi:GT2 family glycosyltransferase
LSDPASGDWQIIVVDNHSSDGEFETFSRRFGQVEFILNNRNGGFAFGCNTGASISRGNHLLFLNPDVIPVPGQVQALLDIKDRHDDVAILTARQVNVKNQLQKSWDVFPNRLTYFKSVKSVLRKLMPASYPDPRTERRELFFCDWVSGAVFLISRKDFDRLGRWCEAYWMYSEDCDLCFQAGRQGMRVAFTSGATFVHLHGGASRQNFEITVRTKTEAIISRHLFNHRNRRGLLRATNHLVIMLAAVPELIVWAAIDLLTLGNFRALRVRRGMLLQVLAHYYRVMRTGDWRSAQMES